MLEEICFIKTLEQYFATQLHEEPDYDNQKDPEALWVQPMQFQSGPQ